MVPADLGGARARRPGPSVPVGHPETEEDPQPLIPRPTRVTTMPGGPSPAALQKNSGSQVAHAPCAPCASKFAADPNALVNNRIR